MAEGVTRDVNCDKEVELWNHIRSQRQRMHGVTASRIAHEGAITKSLKPVHIPIGHRIREPTLHRPGTLKLGVFVDLRGM